MENDSTASTFAALGHPARLMLFRLLVQAEPRGLSVSEIGAHLDMPLSTLAHHLRSLKQAGLIVQTRDGREVQTRAKVQTLRDVLDFMICECCQGVASPIKEDAP